MLFGISVMSGVLFVSRTNRLRFERGVDIIDAVRQAALVQLRPCLMMVLLALLGLLPVYAAAGVMGGLQVDQQRNVPGSN